MRGNSQLQVLISCLICCGLSLWGTVSFTAAQATAPVTIVPELVRDTPFGAGCMPDSPQCDANQNSQLLLHNVVLLSVQPELESQMEETARFGSPNVSEDVPIGQRRQLPNKPRVFGAQIRYERVDLNTRERGLAGDVYSTTLQQMWNVRSFTVGVLLQSDVLELERLDAYRVGLIAYGQYNYRFRLPGASTQRISLLGPSERRMPFLTLSLTANGNYNYTTIDDKAFADVHTFGGGLSAALTVESGAVVVGGAVSYQGHWDDGKAPNNHQHLFTVGMLAGVRLISRLAVTLVGSWTYDPTAYTRVIDPIDTNYFHLGLEVVWNVSPILRLTGGYRKVLALKDVTADTVYLGTLLRF